jgi:DNA-binding MarR family transcriptional regulator
MPEEYLRFLNLLKALEGANSQQIDDACKKLLEVIALEAFLHNKYFTVNDLISLRTLGSPASIHKRLHFLVDKGYVQLVTQTNDARVKKVIPTSQAAKRFSQISKLMVSAVKNQD